MQQYPSSQTYPTAALSYIRWARLWSHLERWLPRNHKLTCRSTSNHRLCACTSTSCINYCVVVTPANHPSSSCIPTVLCSPVYTVPGEMNAVSYGRFPIELIIDISGEIKWQAALTLNPIYRMQPHHFRHFFTTRCLLKHTMLECRECSTHILRINSSYIDSILHRISVQFGFGFNRVSEFRMSAALSVWEAYYMRTR